MKSYTNGRKLLRHLRNFNMPQVSQATNEAKDNAFLPHFGADLLKQRDDLRAQTDWCHSLSLIARNVPDNRGIIITTLLNDDTTAVLLAARLGIDVRLAIALAYDDLIKVVPINDGRFWHVPTKGDDFVMLATFRAAGTEQSDAVLIADKGAQNFKLRFQPEELILYDQHPQCGLYRPYDPLHFQKKMAALCSFRTNEEVFYKAPGEPPAFAPMSPTNLEALRDEISAPFVPSGPKKGWDGEMRKHVEAMVAKHLGPDVAVGISVNGGPTRINL